MKMRKFLRLLRNKGFRLLDSHLGICGFNIWFKILAAYGLTTIYIFTLSTTKYFSFSFEYHFPIGDEHKELYQICLFLWGKKIFNNGEERRDAINKSVEEWSKRREKEKENARKRLSEIDSDLVKYIV